MKIHEDRISPASTYKVCIKRKCDLCGHESKHEDWATGNWENDTTEIKIVIHHKSGTCYPSGGSGDEIEIDLCPECFRNRFIVWLNSQGANIKYEEWDF